MNSKKIIIVDDEEYIVELLDFNLKNAGYTTFKAYTGTEALKIADSEKPDLMLLDLMLPEKDGTEVCSEIRKNPKLKNTSIIMVTAKDEEDDKITGLESGADDYITKPFSVKELLARVKAVLRRTERIMEVEKENSEIFDFGTLKADFTRHEVAVNDKKIDLSLKEYELLETLIKNEGRILKREDLLEKIWGYEYIGETRTVDVHIRYLRKKIEENDKKPKFIETIRGVGYRFNPC